jgi:hypothetical protein
MDAGGVADIQQQERRLAGGVPERLHGLLAVRDLAGPEDDVPTAPGELSADFEADPASGAGDQCGGEQFLDNGYV